MRKMKKNTLSLLFLCLSVLAFSQEDEKPLTYSAMYVGDFLGNTMGGIKKDFTYLGAAKIGINLDTEKAHLWKGGELNLSGYFTHGGTPSRTFIGDFQCVDNYEAGNHAFLFELSYAQTFADKFSVKIGLQDLNADYDACEASSAFVNSSFGIHSVFAGNFTSPIYPITGLALNLKWDISEKWVWQAAIFDGGVIDFDENAYNIKWKLDKSKGYLTMSEWQFVNEREDNFSGIYKLGVNYHTGEKDFGVYGIIDQKIWHNKNHEIGFFATLAYEVNTNKDDDKSVFGEGYYYNNCNLTAGINLNGVFSKKQKDMLGLALTTSFFDEVEIIKSSETAVELMYKYQVNEHIYLKPDLQYIVNPTIFDNALVALLRVGVEF